VDADGANAPDNFPEDSAKQFFYSWATIWRQNITAKLAAKYIAVDPHAPPEVRVNGTVSNMPEFAASFDLKEDDALYRTEDARVDIW
jgi:predicted metalloendopeptidase